MSNLALSPGAPALGNRQREMRSLWIFCVVTVVLHGSQNAIVILNNGLDPGVAGWLMAMVYGAAALLVILFSKGRLGLPAPELSSQPDGYQAAGPLSSAQS